MTALDADARRRSSAPIERTSHSITRSGELSAPLQVAGAVQSGGQLPSPQECDWISSTKVVGMNSASSMPARNSVNFPGGPSIR